jgi:uncharacterized protein YehS (DUF1456 family)
MIDESQKLEERRKQDIQVAELAEAFDRLPLVERLHFVANMISRRIGGEDDQPYDDVNLVVAQEVLWSAIRLAGSIPNVDQIRFEP